MDMLAIFNLTTTEIIVICVVALILFGGSLPAIAKNLGKSMVEFKKGIKDVKEDLETASNTDKNLESKPAREVSAGKVEERETVNK